ncbi:MAG: tetratricopeptide repeat protein [Candidatus Portnoybacteria bacterium]|nr:tetratricopeptide repeat protein [Candidatus Portnoybacteria bacterium]
MPKKLLFAIVIAALVIGVLLLWREPLAETAAEILMQRGNYYFNGGAYDLPKAEQFYRWAIAIHDNTPLAHSKLANVLFIQGKPGEALVHIDKEIAKNPDFGRAYYLRGLIHGFLKNLDEAERDFKTILELHESSNKAQDLGEGGWAVYNDLAWIQFQKGNYADVEKTAQEGLEKYPDNPWLLNDLGLAFLNLGKKAKAKAVFEKALAQAEKLTAQDVIKAYPGNNPAQASDRRLSIITNIRFNKTLTVDN